MTNSDKARMFKSFANYVDSTSQLIQWAELYAGDSENSMNMNEQEKLAAEEIVGVMRKMLDKFEEMDEQFSLITNCAQPII